MPEPKDVLSAGAVVFGPRKQVLLVHRPAYDDWSFPKGKLDRGEHATAAAVREVHEETGLRIRLGPPLGSQRYPVSSGLKTVRYWTGRPMDSPDVSGYEANDEIDTVGWFALEDAVAQLSYPRDRETLREAVGLRKRSVPLVVLRHGEARSRKAWRGDDRLRPLVRQGHHQAAGAVPLLAAYAVERVVTSSSTRCVQTVAPYVEASGCEVEARDPLSEEDATPRAVARIVRRLAAAAERARAGALLCTHRTVLPLVFDSLGLDDPALEKGEALVAHLRHGRVVSFERHSPA